MQDCGVYKSQQNSNMRIVVKALKGDETPLEVDSDAVSVLHVKKSLSEKINIPAENQSLVYKGKPLSDSQTLNHYSITDGARLILSVRTPQKATTPSTEAPQTAAAAESVATASSSAAEPQVPASVPYAYKDWSGLSVKFELVLDKHFSEEDIEKINQYFREELRRCVYSTSLDQIEYIAKESLKIHEDTQYQRREDYYKKYEESGPGGTTQQPTPS